jgi:glutathione S-transferase
MIIDFYIASMNGLRAAIALAACGCGHRYHRLDLDKKDNHQPDFLRLQNLKE